MNTGTNDLGHAAETLDGAVPPFGRPQATRSHRIRWAVAGPATAVVLAGLGYAAELLPGQDDGTTRAGRAGAGPVSSESRSVTDRHNADLDGDGRMDSIVTTIRTDDLESGVSDDLRLQVTLAGSPAQELPIPGGWTARLVDTPDLDADGDLEVLLSSEGGDGATYSLFTLEGGVVARVLAIGDDGVEVPLGAGSTSSGGWRSAYFDDAGAHTLVTVAPWDQESTARVTVQDWALSGPTLQPAGPPTAACITPEVSTWTAPQPC